MKKFLYFLFFLSLGVTVLMWYSTSFGLLFGAKDEMFLYLGRIAGLLFQFFLLMQFVLIGRITWIEKLFGHDELNALHRKNGFSLLVVLICHPFFLVLSYAALTERSLTQQILSFLGNDDVFQAILAVFILLGTICLSMPFIRKKLKYEVWYLSHLTLYLAAFFAFEHQFIGGDFAKSWAVYFWYALNYTVFTLVAYYRFVRPIWNSLRQSFVVEKVVQENESTYSVYITGRNMKEFHFLPGQFAHFFFFGKGFWFAHPFSFSSTENGKNLRITVKNLGDYTSRISSLKAGTRVVIDGPLGRFVEVNPEQKKYLLIAGGIGITPIFALFQDFEAKQKDIAFLYSNKTKDELIFEKEIENLKGKKILFLSNVENTQGFEEGRITKEKIQALVPDFQEREVYICGPTSMMKAIAAGLQELGLSKSQIHYEKFSY